MTILPKKKQPKDTSNNEQHAESPRSPQSIGSAEGRVPYHSHPYSIQRRHSPQQWDTGPHGGHRQDSSSALYDEYSHNYYDAPAAHHKKRPRSSPHRSSNRKHRHIDRSKAHSAYAGFASAPTHSHSLRNYLPPTTPSSDHAGLAASNEEACNSDDESERLALHVEGSSSLDEMEKRFEEIMKKKHLVIKRMKGDGACMFRAVADQVYGDEEMHSVVRHHCIEYMAKNADFFREYVTEDFNNYLMRKRQDHCHGNHVEMQAICELFNRPIEIYEYKAEPSNIFQTSYKTDNAPIRLSYHGGVHYNSIVDPHKATIGVGLGLPGHQPGAADRSLMQNAVRQSEELHIEDAMLQDKLRETDWEQTQSSIEELVARESYLQYLRDKEKGKTKKSDVESSVPQYARTSTATCSTSSGSGGSLLRSADYCEYSQRPRTSRSPPVSYPSTYTAEPVPVTYYGGSSARSLPSPQPSTSGSSSSAGAAAAARATTFDPGLYMFLDWGEDEVMARAIAESQEEYLSSLKKRRSVGSRSSTEDKLSDSHSHSSEGAERDLVSKKDSLKPRRRSSENS